MSAGTFSTHLPDSRDIFSTPPKTYHRLRISTEPLSRNSPLHLFQYRTAIARERPFRHRRRRRHPVSGRRDRIRCGRQPPRKAPVRRCRGASRRTPESPARTRHDRRRRRGTVDGDDDAVDQHHTRERPEREPPEAADQEAHCPADRQSCRNDDRPPASLRPLGRSRPSGPGRRMFAGPRSAARRVSDSRLTSSEAA